jgi:outer membrane receptor protein involved in Fe transport
MTSNSKIRRAVRLALASSAAATAMCGVAAVAQDAAPQEAAADVGTIVVTGSRIARQDYVADSPIVSVSDDAFKNVGATSAEQVLNTLPQFVPSVTTTSNNPENGGQANIDLRGLGTNRNLVLMNGRRLPASNSDGTVDVNIIPTALIERVEVVTGGASAVYGSDAIAGVTNFILKTGFEGVDVETNYGITAEDDGEWWSAGLTLGSNFAADKGNATFHLGYTDRKEVLQGDREWSFLSLDVRQQGNVASGSGTFAEGRIRPSGSNPYSQAAIDQVFGAYGGYTPGSVVPTNSLGTNSDGTLFSQGGQGPNSVIHFTNPQDAAFNPDGYTYNFNPTNLMDIPVKRYNLAAFMNYDISESVNAYAQAIYTDYDTRVQLASTPATSAQQLVPVTNPFIPADLATLLASRPDPTAPFLISRRMEEVGPRTDRNQYKVWQFLAGVKGDVGENYNWEIYASRSQMDQVETLGGDLSIARIVQLLNEPDGGVATCGGFDVFGRGEVSQGCADFVNVYFTNTTRVEQTVAEATFGGKLFSMPAGEAMFSIGTDYREDTYEFVPDFQVASGDLVGFSQQNPLDGAINVTEVFAEARFPLLADLPAVRSLEATLGYRWSDYNLSGTTDSYKAELNWEIVDPFRVRASYQRAVRAPSIQELFNPLDQNFPPLVEDPCDVTSTARAGADSTINTADDPATRAAVEALCVAQDPAIDLAGYSYPFTQVETFEPGNPNLQEESADTYTLGFVFDSPSSSQFLENLRVSVDYWNIQLDDAIFSLPAGEILVNCFRQETNPTFDPNNPACQLVDRLVYGDSSPVITSATAANVSSLETAGVDVQLDWGLDFGGAGRLATNLVVTYLDKYEFQFAPGLPIVDRVGTIGDSIGSSYPEYKMLLNLDYSISKFRVGARYRYLPSMDNKYADYDPFTTVGVPSIDYLDLNASWYPTEASELTVGAINVTDQEPPLYTTYPQMNTDPSTYDVLGRRYYVRAAYRF